MAVEPTEYAANACGIKVYVFFHRPHGFHGKSEALGSLDFPIEVRIID